MTDEVQSAPTFAVEVTTHGELPDVAGYARAKIGSLGGLFASPASRAHVSVTRRRDPAVEHPVVAHANLEIGGHVLTAEAEADAAREAVDMLEARLRRRLVHHLEWTRRQHRPGLAPPWRSPQVDGAGVPDESGHVVRRKSFSTVPCSVDVALAEMELFGYDFHLFREIGSGVAAVVYRGGPTGYRLALVAPALAPRVAPFEQLVTISPHPLPCLTEDQALERLALLGTPFLFFIEASEGRAGVLYRRLDGDFGLITPAA